MVYQSQEKYVQGRIGGRLATGASISVLSPPVGTAVTAAAIVGNLSAAGVDVNDKAAVILAILTGEKL